MPNLWSTGYGTVVSPLSLVLVPLHNWKYWCPCLVYIRHWEAKRNKVHSHIKIVSFNLVWIVRSIPQLTATFHILSSVLLWMWLRLAINEVRRVGPGGLLWLGLCCNSFSKMFLGERGAKFLFFKNCLNLWKSICGVGSWVLLTKCFSTSNPDPKQINQVERNPWTRFFISAGQHGVWLRETGKPISCEVLLANITCYLQGAHIRTWATRWFGISVPSTLARSDHAQQGNPFKWYVLLLFHAFSTTVQLRNIWRWEFM